MALTFSTSQISLIAFVMHPMECRLDPASEPFDVFSETAVTRYRRRPTRGQPPSLTAPSASSPAHTTPPKTVFVLCLAFSSSTTITFFHPYFSPRTHTRRESAIPLGFISEAGAGTTLRGSTYSSTLHATWTLRITIQQSRQTRQPASEPLPLSSPPVPPPSQLSPVSTNNVSAACLLG